MTSLKPMTVVLSFWTSMGNSIKESDVPFDKPDEFDFNDLKDTRLLHV